MMRIFPFPPGIKFTYPYHNYYGSSFYRFMQLELLICTSTSIFKHFLYTNMSYICNAKIGCNFITLSFQHTQLQHFCPEIPQQRAGYSTSMRYGLPKPDTTMKPCLRNTSFLRGALWYKYFLEGKNVLLVHQEFRRCGNTNSPWTWPFSYSFVRGS